jgi:hypothetical protein
MWRRRLADLTFVAMEAIALFVLGSLLAGIGSRPGPGLGTLLAGGFGGFFLARALQRFDIPRRPLLTVGGSASLLGLWVLGSLQYGGPAGPLDLSPLVRLAADPAHVLDIHTAEALGLGVLALAWLRGGLAGARLELNHRVALGSLTVGLAIVAVGLSFGRASMSSRAIDEAAVPFLIAGLLTLALVHLSQSEHIQSDSLRGPWLLVLGGTVAILALAAAVAGLLPLGLFNRLLAPLGDLLLLLLDVLIYTLALPVVLLVDWLLVHILGGHLHRIDFPAQPASTAARQLQHQAHRSGFALVLIDLGHVLFVLAVAATVGLILWWLFNKLVRVTPADQLPRESVRLEADLGGDLRTLWQNLRRRLRRPDNPAEPPLSPRLLQLRRIYLSLLRRAAASGLSKPAAATPLEFAGDLTAHFDSSGAARVSEYFSAGRYGLVEPREDTLKELDDDVAALKP